MADTLNIDQAGHVAIKAVDGKGNPVTLDSITFTSSDPTVATTSADGSAVQPVGIGVTTLNLDAVYKGAHFPATDVLTIDAGSLASLSFTVVVNAPAA